MSGQPIAKVQVRQSVDLESDNSRPVSWHVGSFDWKGPWGCKNFVGINVSEFVLGKIKNFEGCSWNDLKKHLHHSIEVQMLNPIAQKQLAQIEQDDTDQIFSLRLQGRHRIYGIKDGSIMRVIWYDTDHGDNENCVCRSKKKHT